MHVQVSTKVITKSLFMIVVIALFTACGAPVATPAANQTTAATTASAAATPVTQAPATSGGTLDDSVLTYGMGGTFDKIDPNATTFSRVGKIGMHIADPLVWQPQPGTFEPGLATEWSINADATEYTFKLRQDVKFHDGTPFNAAALKFTYDRIADPATKAQTALSLLGPYKETEVINDYEVKVRFNTPFAPFLDSLSSSYLTPISPTAYQRVGAENWGITEYVGTGPYKLQSYTPDSEVVLVRNPDYNWAPAFAGVNGPAKISQIVFKIITEPATRIASKETGEVNFVEDVPEIDFNRMKDNPDFVSLAVPQPGSGWSLMMNVQNSPMDQLAVRRAIQLASDKQGMITSIWNGIGQVGCGPITHATFAFDEATCSMYTYSIEEAQKTLEDDGWVDSDGDGTREKDGKPLVIGHYYNADSALSQLMADYMKSDLAKVGIQVELNGLSRSGYFDAVRSGKHHTQNWWDTGTDPDVVRVLLYSKNAGGGTNRNNYINPEMDTLIDAAAGTTDSAERVELYKQIQKKVMDEAIMVFYNDPTTLYVHDQTLQNPVMYLGGNIPYFYPASFTQ